jgi:sulfopyruvate decarboxylase TPP-binding subunit
MGNITKELFELAGIECKEILNTNELNLIKKTIVKNYDNGKSMAFLFPLSFWNEIE